MSHRYLISILGCVLMILGVIEGGWFFVAIWLGSNFFVLGIAHGFGAHRVFGKRADGTLPVWNWVLFLPLLVFTNTVWHLIRFFSREPACNIVTEKLVIGRRLLAAELAEEFDNYVDLTSEFFEPSDIRRSPSYRSFPILDGGAPTPQALHVVVSRLRPGRTFVHCAQGHGRTGLFALAVLLSSGVVQTIEEGLRMLSAARPAIRLNQAQLRCIEKYVRLLGEEQMH